MTVSMHALAIGTFVPMLRTLSHLFEKAEEHARTKGVDVSALASARLAPDMYTFSMQVQLACYQAKAAVAQLTGEVPPPPPKDSETFAELKQRVEQTVRELESVSEATLEGAEDRVIKMPLIGTMYFEATGSQFLRDWALPHFYFHVVTAYDILRREGVDIGKRDYLRHAGEYIRGQPSHDGA
jgi:uncharacterized protein